MDNSFLIIAVSRPDFFKGESEMINEILVNKRAQFIHLRKPNSNIREMENLIRNIDQRYYDKIKLHDHFDLVEKFKLGGIHLNSRNPLKNCDKYSCSISLHSLNEVKDAIDFDYFFISPVFDSISKKGYKAAFDYVELSNQIKGKKAVALGGVSPDKIPFLKSLGFHGGAMLSYFFPSH